ncbi:6,7-dimethyl-8-ribityllumazine synthase [Candidatus Woesearchaeota archaeon]|nr:6,7-dimethyl-8-ribityllumazine synthase [Candidatus Woesearchaeota archaeon]
MTEKLGMVVSQFNYEITGEMSKKAQQRAKDTGARIVKIIEVPGSFEIPLAVKELLEDKNIEGVITIGTIIKGGTDHDMVIAHAIARKLMDLSCEYLKPVSLGISGPNITWLIKMLRKE